MTILGVDTKTNQPICLGAKERTRGTYIIGSTGTGKTTLLQSIAFQDMEAGDGLCVLDPHGDMIDWLLERVPAKRKDDVILFDPSKVERPFGLNLLACDRDDPKQVQWVVNNFVATLRRLYEHSWGPLLEHVLNHTLWTAMKIKDSTLVEVLLLLTNEIYRKEQVTEINEPLLRNFWNEFPKGNRQQLDFTSSTVNKLTPFLLDESMRHIVGQSENTFDLREMMDERKILLVNLSKGDLGENNSALLGSVLVNLILITALSRRNMPLAERQKKQFHVIVDEFQNFASDSFSILQSEARKYAVDLVVAHQFRDQLTLEIRGSALNVGNFIFFQTTGVDAPELASQFDNTPPPSKKILEPTTQKVQGEPDLYRIGNYGKWVDGPQRLYADRRLERANDLVNLAPYNAMARLLSQDEQSKPIIIESHIETINPDGQTFEGNDLAKAVYGEALPATAAYIRDNSLKLADAKEVVARDVYIRTSGLASMTNTLNQRPLQYIKHQSRVSVAKQPDWTKRVQWDKVDWETLIVDGGQPQNLRSRPSRPKEKSVLISKRDRAIFEFIWDCDGIVASRHLRELFWAGKAKSGARNRLRSLYEHKYLEQPDLEKKHHRGVPEHIYWLGKQAYDYLKIDNKQRNLYMIRNMNTINLKHHLAIVDVRMKLMRDAIFTDGGTLDTWLSDKLFNSKKPQITVVEDGLLQMRRVIPDGFFSVLYERQLSSQRRHNFIIEVDRAKKKQKLINEQLHYGAHFIDSDPYLELTGVQSGRGLMITTGWKRVENMMVEALDRDVEWAWYFTTFADLMNRTNNAFLDPIWKQIDERGAITEVKLLSI